MQIADNILKLRPYPRLPDSFTSHVQQQPLGIWVLVSELSERTVALRTHVQVPSKPLHLHSMHGVCWIALLASRETLKERSRLFCMRSSVPTICLSERNLTAGGDASATEAATSTISAESFIVSKSSVAGRFGSGCDRCDDRYQSGFKGSYRASKRAHAVILKEEIPLPINLKLTPEDGRKLPSPSPISATKVRLPVLVAAQFEPWQSICAPRCALLCAVVRISSILVDARGLVYRLNGCRLRARKVEQLFKEHRLIR